MVDAYLRFPHEAIIFPTPPHQPEKPRGTHPGDITTIASDILGRMLMVIFGAGASYDSSPDYPPSQATGAHLQWRPPLADQLFDNPRRTFSLIVQKYPKLPHVLTFLRQRFDEKAGKEKSVEEVLEQLQQESAKDRTGERQRELATIQFYLRDLLFDVTNSWSTETDSVTNYATLVGEIARLNSHDEPVALVTFNYDLILDRALATFNGYHEQEPHKQLDAHPTLKLFKPHGSVDWARVVNLPPGKGLERNQLIDDAPAIQLTDEFIRVAHYSNADQHPYGKTVYPTIAIPLQNKTENTFVWPPNHLTEFQELLPSVTKILIIGWQAREAHFIALLKGSLPRVSHLMVVGRDAADAVETLERFATSTRLVEAIKIDRAAVVSRGVRDFTEPRPDDALPYVRRIRLSVAPGGFSDFARNRRLIEFLNAQPPT